jgi:hypothetical protein
VNHRRFLAYLLCVYATTSVASGADAWAGELSYQPNVRYQSMYNDNRRLRVANEESLIGHVLRVGTNLRYRTESTEINVDPLLRFERWWGDETLDTDDQELELSATRTGERYQLRFNAAVVRDTTLSTDFESIDSAQVSNRRRRETLSAAPTAAYQLNPRTVLTANANTQKTYFPKSGSTSLVGFNFCSATLGARYSLTERLTLSPNGLVSRFRAPDVNASTDTVGIGLGAEYQHSPTLFASLSGSVRTSKLESRSLTKPLRDASYTALVSVNKRYGRGDITASVTRSSSPTSSGFLIQRQSLSLEWEHRFWEHLIGTLDASYDEDTSLGQLSTSEDQRHARISAQLRFLVTREWALIGGYRYVERNRDNQASPAKSNAMSITLQYRPLRSLLNW